MSNYREPQVFLVGAGPGNPGLLTLRAVECLSQADLVLYDRLVPSRLLDYAPADAERICVTELAEHHVERCPHINQTLLEAARQGKRVVRLKGGDPLVFGRGGEEAEILRAAGIPYEIVPGVTAGLAAAAYAGIPLTHRLHASAVAFVTGHEDSDKHESALDWSLIAQFPGTLAIYMGMSRLPQIVQDLINHGKKADTPAAVVHMASTGSQQTVEAPLADLPSAVQKAGLKSPAVILIGDVVGLRRQLAWFEQRPLFGKSVLVTRPKHQAEGLASRLDQLGAVVHLLPTIEIQDPPDWGPVDRALERLGSFQWLVFTSANGVHAFMGRLRKTGRDLRALGTIRLAAIGPATADALRSYHLEPDLVPEEYRSESLAEALRDQVRGQRVLLARADRGRDLLRDELAKITEVTQVVVYSQADVLKPGSESLACLTRGEIDYVLLTSSNITRVFAAALGPKGRQMIQIGRVKLISISPVTSAAIVEMGLSVAAEAKEYTTAGLIDALVELATGNN
jgi:uroporphyrinogen III methyltransferase/synthase